ncbi:MAG: putative Ig domain-containing protein, partial [Sulfuritalea sp.]|nr:putative Ig domain-containing protein [Sulfuritalea sp.]
RQTSLSGKIFSDPDGDLLTLAVTQVDGSTLPAWLSYDATTRVLTGNPPPSAHGTLALKVVASDGRGGTVNAPLNLVISNANDTPTVDQGITAQTWTGSGAKSFTLPANVFADADMGDTRTLTARLASGAALPDWLSFNATTGVFSGNPARGLAALDIMVTATDSQSASETAGFRLSFTNTNDAPLAATIATQTFSGAGDWAYTPTSNAFTDADGDVLNLSASLADGSALPGWLTFDAVNRRFTGNPPAGAADLSLKMTVTDTSGQSASTSFLLDINQAIGTNDAPTVLQALAITPSFTGPGSLTVAVPLAPTFRDLDGESLTYSAKLSSGADLPAWLTFDPIAGTLTGNPPHDATSLAIAIFATDGSNATAQSGFTLTLSSTNDAPALKSTLTAQAATQSSTFSYTLPADAFADADPEATLSYAATLANGNALPSWLSFDATTRRFSGTPTNGDVGIIALKVTATDAGNASANATFNLTVANVNDVPAVANVITAQTATEDSAFSFTVPANTFVDIDVGDSLTYVATMADGSVLPSWLVFNASTRSFSGTPTNDQVGTFSLNVTATDSAKANVSTTFNLVVANTNDAPTKVAEIGKRGATQDQPFTFTIPANIFADVDLGDTLTYSVGNKPAWLSFNAATRTFSGTPGNSDVSGPITLTVTATDSANVTASADFTLAVFNVNDAPMLVNPVEDTAATEDSVFSFVVPDTTFSDVDAGVSLRYSAALASGDDLPGWLSFSPLTRTFSGTPTNHDVGEITVRISAADPDGASRSDDFKITVTNVNDAPTFTSKAPITATEDSVYSYTIATSDVDANDTRVITATTKPAWLSLTDNGNGTATLSGTPGDASVGTHNLVLTVADATGASITQDFSVTVANIDDAATATLTMSGSASEGGTLTATLSNLSDDDGNPVPAYQWQLSDNTNDGWQNLVGATTANYAIASDQSQVGKYLRLIATSTDARGGSTVFTGTATGPIVNVDDAATGLLTVTGTAAEGGVFAARLGSISDPDGSTTTSWRWQISDNGSDAWSDIAGANSSNYTLAADQSQVGKFVRASATTTDVLGGSTVFVGEAAGPIANVDDPATGSLAIAGTAKEGGTVTANIASIVDPDGAITAAYRWQISSNGTDNWSDIEGANDANYVIASDESQVGKYLRVMAVTTDSFGGNTSWTSVASLSIANTNDVPTLTNAIADQSATEDSAYSFTMPANTFADVDLGDSLTYITSALPAWLSFDAATRTFSGTPTNSDVGLSTITVTASDGVGATASDSFTLTVGNTNDAPTVVIEIPEQHLVAAQAFSFALPTGVFADVDVAYGDKLTLSATRADGSSLPAWLIFDPVRAIFSGTVDAVANGSIQVRVTATDKTGASISAEFGLDITPLPVISLPTPAPVEPPSVPVIVTTPETPLTAPVALSLPIEATAPIVSLVTPVAPTVPQQDTQPVPTQRSPEPLAPGNVGVAPAVRLAPDLAGPILTSTDGFPISVLPSSAASVGMVEQLVTIKPMTEIVSTGSQVAFTLAHDVFAHASPAAVVTLSATQINGVALPIWLTFNPQTGAFVGIAPENFQGELVILVTARDKDGREAVATIRLGVGGGQLQRQGAPSREAEPGAQRSGMENNAGDDLASAEALILARQKGQGREATGGMETTSIIGKPSLAAQFGKLGIANRHARADELIRVAHRAAAQRNTGATALPRT